MQVGWSQELTQQWHTIAKPFGTMCTRPQRQNIVSVEPRQYPQNPPGLNSSFHNKLDRNKLTQVIIHLTQLESPLSTGLKVQTTNMIQKSDIVGIASKHFFKIMNGNTTNIETIKFDEPKDLKQLRINRKLCIGVWMLISSQLAFVV